MLLRQASPPEQQCLPSVLSGAWGVCVEGSPPYSQTPGTSRSPAICLSISKLDTELHLCHILRVPEGQGRCPPV